MIDDSQRRVVSSYAAVAVVATAAARFTSMGVDEDDYGVPSGWVWIATAWRHTINGKYNFK